VSNIKQTALPQTVNPAAASAAGSKFVKAGESFTATVTAMTSGGVATPNFGKEATPEGVMLTRNLVLPVAGNSGTLTNNIIAGGSFSTGAATATNLAWNEVGIITLTPSVGDGDYLGVGDVTGTTTGNIGRFYPDHFAITSPTVTAACSTGTTPFSYFGQDGFTTIFTVTAQNTANTTTTNYTGAVTASTWAKLPLTTWGSAPASAANPGFGFAVSTWSPSQPSGSSLAASVTAPTATNTNAWSAGTTTVTAKHQIGRPTAAAAPTTVTVTTQPVDSDGATSIAATSIGSPLLRYGRLKINNAYGSELLALPVNVAAQYWSGSTYVNNADDGCTALSSSNLSQTAGSGATITTSIPAVAVTLFSGVGVITLTKPSPTPSGKGSVVLRSNPANLGIYLPSSGGNETFGIYKSKFIYLRENY
jgi:MSHA biogenesis protein MshQ